MNFLAHLYLSGENHELIIGNFIADHVKGNSVALFSEGVRAGINLHRAIDQFTDQHQVVRSAVEHLRPDYRKYAGVIVDMYFDHFLASGWSKWSGEPLKIFTARMYDVLMKSFSVLPERTRRMLPHMMEHDWLYNYGNFEGLHLALSGMARRTPFSSNMETATRKLKGEYSFYANSFEQFFPELIAFATLYREEMVAPGQISNL
ncbi:MAG: DUF479 domain-containing protein [Lentimicrobiaceae bacterium]|nr:DUF479 domain-containing protein [Lentimicrobiaceae bacterium]